jgi:hypothetical protein
MNYTTVKVAGRDAVRVLEEHRSRYRMTGKYPFLIGDREDLDRMQEAAEYVECDPIEIVQRSLSINIADWIAERRVEAEEYEFSEEGLLGVWPGEIRDKGSIGLHKDVLSGKMKQEVYLGLATIDQPWHLPAVLRFGSWNECPAPEVHCALHREWQAEFGAEITGVSGDVIECVVANPPSKRADAIRLAWQQYWYCNDIVDQGCETVANLAATILNSKYWCFWWD